MPLTTITFFLAKQIFVPIKRRKSAHLCNFQENIPILKKTHLQSILFEFSGLLFPWNNKFVCLCGCLFYVRALLSRIVNQGRIQEKRLSVLKPPAQKNQTCKNITKMCRNEILMNLFEFFMSIPPPQKKDYVPLRRNMMNTV